VIAAMRSAPMGERHLHAERYSASESGRDARELAENLGIHFQVVEIEETFKDYLRMMRPRSTGSPKTPPRRTSSRAFAAHPDGALE